MIYSTSYLAKNVLCLSSSGARKILDRAGVKPVGERPAHGLIRDTRMWGQDAYLVCKAHRAMLDARVKRRMAKEARKAAKPAAPEATALRAAPAPAPFIGEITTRLDRIDSALAQLRATVESLRPPVFANGSGQRPSQWDKFLPADKYTLVST